MKQPKLSQAGFTMIELMVGMVIGLISCAAIMQVMMNAEGQKRSTTGNVRAQVNGSLSMNALIADISKAGYGFTSIPSVIGCPLQNAYTGTTLATLPSNLVPVIITPGTSTQSDTIRVISSSKSSYAVPIRVASPGYAPSSTAVTTTSVRGIKGPTTDLSGNVTSPGDLVALAIDDVTPCQMFQVSKDPTQAQVDRVDDQKWNWSLFPNTSYGDGAYLINLGALNDSTYSVVGEDLIQKRFVISTASAASYETRTLFNNVVFFKALYGKDTNGDGTVDSWDTTTPTTNSGWKQVLAVRIAVVSKSDQMEKENVTSSAPTIDVGTTDTVAGSYQCGNSNCLKLDITTQSNWQQYRYKVFDTTIPLRNMLWSS